MLLWIVNNDVVFSDADESENSSAEESKDSAVTVSAFYTAYNPDN